MKKFWQNVKQWFFWTLFPTEAATLDRYRIHNGELERWFSHCSPEISQTATWMRQQCETKRVPGEWYAYLSIFQFREKLFGQPPKRRQTLTEPTTELRFVVNTQADKLELLQALKHIHDANVDTDIPMVNSLCHVYQAPWFIQVRQPSPAVDDAVVLVSSRSAMTYSEKLEKLLESFEITPSGTIQLKGHFLIG